MTAFLFHFHTILLCKCISQMDEPLLPFRYWNTIVSSKWFPDYVFTLLVLELCCLLWFSINVTFQRWAMGRKFYPQRSLKKNNPWVITEDAGKKKKKTLVSQMHVPETFTKHLLSALTQAPGGIRGCTAQDPFTGRPHTQQWGCSCGCHTSQRATGNLKARHTKYRDRMKKKIISSWGTRAGLGKMAFKCWKTS